MAALSLSEAELLEACRSSGVPAAGVFAADTGGTRALAAGCGQDAVFPACSLSKAPFCLLVAQLALEARLDLDAPLAELVPPAEMAAAVAPAHLQLVGQCTVRDVLSHRTGLPNWICQSRLGHAARAELRGPPGAVYSYSGTGFILLQLAVQAVGGADLETLAQRAVFGPLGMRRSSFVWQESYEPGAASPAMPPTPPSGPPTHWRPRGPLAPSSLFSTARELGLLFGHVARLLAGLPVPPGTPLAAPGGDALCRQLCLPGSPALSRCGRLRWSSMMAVESHDEPAEDRLWMWGKTEGCRAWAQLAPASGALMVVLTNSWRGAEIIDLAVRRFETPGPGAPWGEGFRESLRCLRDPHGPMMMWSRGHHPEYLQTRHLEALPQESFMNPRSDRDWASELMHQRLSGQWAPQPLPLRAETAGPAVTQPVAHGVFSEPDTDRLRDEWGWARNRAGDQGLRRRLARLAHKPRIAIAGVALEANKFAPVTRREDFGRLEGARLLEACRHSSGKGLSSDVFAAGFVSVLDQLLGPAGWEPVPLVVLEAHPGGPPDTALLQEFASEVAAGLSEAGELDGCFCPIHGGMRALGPDMAWAEDPDGCFLAAVRAALPECARLVATLDLHCNISQLMIEASDVLVAHRTNPHVDAHQRGEEAAMAMLELLAAGQQARPFAAVVRLPLVTPAVRQLTAAGQPVGDAIRLAQELLARANGWPRLDSDSDDSRNNLAEPPQLLCCSVCPGFAWADTQKNGLTVLAYSLDGTDPAARAQSQQLALQVASATWQARQQYKVALTSLEEAVDQALERAKPGRPIVLCDCGDNPGAGARGNTVHILKALLASGHGATGAVVGCLYDPPLAAAAVQAGPGAEISASFNSSEDDPRSGTLGPLPACVLQTSSNGEFMGTRGMVLGRRVRLGLAALLAVRSEQAEVFVVVSSVRQQVLSTDYFGFLGLDVSGVPNAFAASAEPDSGACSGGAIRIIAVKSRGHFRAGFQHIASHDRIIEVDAPGLSSQELSRFEWTRLIRPCYPLDSAMLDAAPEDGTVPTLEESCLTDGIAETSCERRSSWLCVCKPHARPRAQL